MPDKGDALRKLLQAETRAESGSEPQAGAFLVPGLTILHHPDIERVGERVLLAGLPAGREEILSRAEPDFSLPGRNVPRPLADPYLSRRPIRFAPGAEPGGVRLAGGASGTSLAVDGVPVSDALELTAARLDRGVVLLLANRIVLALSRLDPAGAEEGPGFGLVGESAAMTALRREIRRVAGLDIPVLLRGETGSGKELVARALHDAGPRRSRTWLAVNMAAVPPALAAAELFGAARGAYTGADRRREGYFQRADGGTLFLDEVGDTPPEVQPLLLRALETGEVQLVGGEDVRRVDVRLIAATDADLDAAVAAGRFRAPLLHRLAGYEIRVPPLRQRRDDFGRLFYSFLRRELEDLGEAHRLATPPEGRPFLPAAMVARLAAWDWPGNVRQLKNAARQIAIAGRDAGEPDLWLQVERLLQEAASPPRPPDAAPPVLPPSRESAPPPDRPSRDPEDLSEEEILVALRASRWRIQQTAERLGISRGLLYDRIEKSSKIRKAADLSQGEIEQAFQRCGGDLDAMAEALEVSRRGLKRRMTQLGMT